LTKYSNFSQNVNGIDQGTFFKILVSLLNI